MKQKTNAPYTRAKKRFAITAIVCLVLSQISGPISLLPTVEAASSFKPTIFVSTEAFLAIDDDDTTADVVLRFGDTLAKTIAFNRILDRFEFNDDVHTSGSYTASGTIVTESGAYIDGTSLVVQAASNNVGIGTAAPLADLHIVGSETRLDTGTTNGTTSLSFVDNNDEKAHFLLNQATQTFDVQSDGRLSVTSSDYVNVSGTNYTNIQGSTTFIGNNVGIGTTGPKTMLDVAGAISGSFIYATRSFSGAGLTDCDSGTSKLLWDATTGRFSCGTITSSTYTAGQGLSLNGANAFSLNTTITGSLVNFQTVSGATVYAKNALRSSGSLTWEGIGSGAKLFVKDFVSVGSRASGSLLTVGRVGSGTSAFTTSSATLFSTDQMALGQLTGGAYFGRVGLKENQWGLNSYGNKWEAKDSSRSWKSIAMSSDGKILTAVVNSGQIYVSYDYGNTWTAKDSSRVWDSVAMSSDGKHQTAVVNGGQIYTSSDFGATWSAKDSSRAWNAIAMSSDGKTQTAVVNSGQIYVSYNYGNSWTARESSRAWFSVAMSSDGKIQLAGTQSGRLYESYDYGATWTAKESSRVWWSVSMSSDGKYQTALDVSPGYIYTSSDYGNTWTAHTEVGGIPADWLSTAMSSDGRIQVAALFAGPIYISTDYGATWASKGPSANWYGMAMSSDGKVIAGAADGGNIYVSNATSFQYGSVAIGTGSVKGDVKLMVQGILSGVTLYATRSFSGAGLSDCDTAGTSKLLWDATTGRFSCGTDQTGSYTAGQGLSLNGANAFSLKSTVTGAVIQAANVLASSGSLSWKGAGSGKSIAVMQDSYFLGNVAFGATTAETKLEVAGTASGGMVYAERQLSTSGSTTLGEDNTDNVVFNADVNSNITPNTNNSFDFGSSTARWANGWFNNANLSANISVLGTSLLTGNVGIGAGNTTTKAALNVSGVMSGITVYATQSFSGAGLTDCDSGTSKLLWDATTGRFSCGTITSSTYTAGQGLSLNGANAFSLNTTITGSLVRFTTVSGSTVYAKSLLGSSGSLAIEGDANIDDTTLVVNSATDDVSIGTTSTNTEVLINSSKLNGTVLSLNSSATNDAVSLGYTLGGAGRIRLTDGFSTNIEISANGSTYFGGGNVGVNVYGAKTEFETRGAISGSTLFASRAFSGAGLSDCDTAGTSKLLWDATTGRFSCGTDQGASYTAGQGLTLTSTSFKVNDTLTGTLLKFATATGSLARFLTLSGSTVYAKNSLRSSGSVIISGPNPTLLTTYNSSGNATGIAVTGRYAYLADDGNGLLILDISKPGTTPTLIGQYDTPANALDVAVSGKYAYVADGTAGLHIIDVSNPASPRLIGTYNTSDTAYAVAIAGKYAYVADATSGMHVINIEDPTTPTLTGTYAPGGGQIRDVAVQGNYAYIGDINALMLRVVDVSDPTRPIQKGSVSAGDAVYGVAIDGRYAYIAANGAGMKIVDVSNPASPSVVGTYNTPGAAVKVAVGGRYVYVADYNTGGLQIVDVADVTAPVSAGSYLTASYVFDVAISGRYVYLADYQQGMDTIKINGLDAPAATIGTLDTYNLNVFSSARIASSLSVESGLNVTGGMHILGQSSLHTASGAALTLSQSGTTKVPILMNVRGLFSGATLYARTMLRSSGSLVWEGAASGATLYLGGKLEGAGLTDCSNGTTSKLLWNSTTGRFSCGTDQTGGGSLTAGQGLTMNGTALSVNATLTGTLLKFTTLTGSLVSVQTLSGRTLNISGTGSSPLLSTSLGKPTVRIGGSGSLVLEARSTDPGSAPANTSSLFAQKVGGRSMLHQGSGSTFAASPLQNALFGNLVMMLSTGAGTTVNGYGTTVTNDTTVSHPAAGETFGYMTNFATAATNGDEAGTSSTTTSFFRGSTTGANGFFYYARVGVVDTTSITVFSGMADQTIATMVGADNPAGNHVGFQFSTGRGDTNWMFTTKDNTTQNVNSTGMAFTANKVYDLMFMCTKQCASITWEIRNVTDGTRATGTTSSNLPTAGTALRIVLGVEAETTTAKNIRMQQIYVEADR